VSQQLPLFDVDSPWRPPEILPEWQNASVLAIDTETNDPNLTDRGPGWPWGGGHLAGVAIGLRHGDRTDAFYLPVGHQEGSNLDDDLVRRYVDEIMRSSIPKVFHNGMYDLGWMWRWGATVCRGQLHDTQIGAALIDENRMSYSLDNLSKDWLGGGKDEEHLKKAGAVWGFKTQKELKKNMWRMPPRHVGPYAEGDVIQTMDLYLYEQEILASQDLMDLYHLEMEMLPVLVEMRKRGIRIDYSKAEQARVQIQGLEKDLIKNLKSKWGITMDVWSPGSVAKAFKKLDIPHPHTDIGNPSFTKEFLEGHSHEMPRTVRQLRKLGKTVNTFIDGQIGNHAHDGRIHCELHPMKSDDGGTVSGRLSASNPNLQQNSGRDEFLAPIVRGMFLPEEGSIWSAQDYSSQEPRLTLHYAFLTKQTGAAEAVEQFRRDPHTDYHQMVADICNIGRKQAKPINLGLPYGMGEAKLCHDLGLPTAWMVKMDDKWQHSDEKSTTFPCYEIAGPEGKSILDQFHDRLPYMKGLMNTTSNLAGKRGFIKTILNRRCRFDLYEPQWGRTDRPLPLEAAQARGQTDKRWKKLKRAFTHKALNRLIQGSAADQTKKAMVEMHKQGLWMMLQMHDEIDLSVTEEKEYKMAEEIMIEAVPLSVPISVDSEFGKNWGDAKHSWEDFHALAR